MYERMLDKHNTPTMADLEEYCGKGEEFFISLNTFLNLCGTISSIRFPYGNSYGFSVCHRLKNKLVCDCFPEKDAFTLMIRLTNSQFERCSLLVNSRTNEFIVNKYPCGNGGWIHFRIIDDASLSDAKILVKEKILNK